MTASKKSRAARGATRRAAAPARPEAPGTRRRAAAKPYHHGDLRRALTEGALALVAEVGTAGFTLRELARRIGVSHAAPYRHFVDKRALLTALATEGSALMYGRIAGALAEAGDELRARFLAAGYAYVRFALDEPALFTTMFSAELDTADAALAAARERSLGLLRAFIAEAQARGAIGAGAARDLAMPVWSMHHGLATLAIAGAFAGKSEAEVRAVVDHAHAALLDGLLVRAPSPRPSRARSV